MKQSKHPLQVQNEYWKETLVMAMHALNTKEIRIPEEVLFSITKACPPGEIAYLVITKPSTAPKSAGFSICLAYGKSERDAIHARQAPQPPSAEPVKS